LVLLEGDLREKREELARFVRRLSRGTSSTTHRGFDI
jgi:hypothetical protein